jgi:hypothetical protein
MANEKLTKFILACNEAKKITPFRGRLLALDPGETTGYAVFQGQPETGYDWLAIDQIKTWPEHDAYSTSPTGSTIGSRTITSGHKSTQYR